MSFFSLSFNSSTLFIVVIILLYVIELANLTIQNLDESLVLL
ncbi:Uncharacterised protein [Mycobacteroides abscessus subsp. abscessus]|nr:Uncharacterised protein [Mycobacteroides abscessus subsp. abscessus]